MAALTGLTTVKRFPYRGDTQEEWSSTYHFRQAPPASSAEWKVFADAVLEQEAAIWPADTKSSKVYGYADDSAKPISVFSHDYILAGDFHTGVLPAAGARMAGDQAAMIWWRLDHRNSRGKWVYLRKYVHGGHVALAGGDSLDPAYLAALGVWAAAVVAPPTPIGGGIRARTGDWPVLDHGVSPYVTTRTLKRRGKRPLPHA